MPGLLYVQVQVRTPSDKHLSRVDKRALGA